MMRPKSGPKNRPDNHVSLKPGEGWHKRNFLSEVLIPSLFEKRGVRSPRTIFPELKAGQLCITWIGHATFLIQTPEHSVLIDPNWAKWLKVIKRLKLPGVELHDLPEVDIVLVTHAHFDHLDRKTLRAVASEQPIVVPRNVGKLVHGLGFERVHELDSWQTLRHGHLKITLTPARHWGARVLHDSHRGFGGFFVEYAGRTVFHAGDTSYFDGFSSIGERANIDIALLPIGAYDAPTKRDVHMNPEEALRAFVELGARMMVPMHYGTFRLSYEPIHEPPVRLRKRAAEMGLLDRICVLNEGEPKVF